MDRFIDTVNKYCIYFSENLKSNMDRFIVYTNPQLGWFLCI